MLTPEEDDSSVLKDEEIDKIKEKQLKPSEKPEPILTDEEVEKVRENQMTPFKLVLPPKLVELRKKLGLDQ